MQGLLASVRGIVDAVSEWAPSGCGCQKEQSKIEAGLAQVFSLHPLSNADPEAVRATQRGSRFLHEGRSEEALRELHDANQLAPGNAVASANLGCAYHASGDDNTALYWYRQSHRISARDETATLGLALLEQHRGQVDEAQRLLVTFLREVDSAHVGALKQLAKLHQQEGHYSQAAGIFHRLIAVDPTNNEWPASMQTCLDQLPVKDAHGDLVTNNQGGLARGFSFAEGISSDSKEASSKQSLQRSSFGNQQPQRGSFPGQSLPNPAAPPAPPAAQTESRLYEARRLREAGHADSALTIYRQVLNVDGRNTGALLGVTDCQCDLGDIDAALDAGKQLLSAKPDGAEGNLRVAELLLRAGHHPDMAEPYLKKAASDPSSGRGLQHRLLCCTAEAAIAKEDHQKALASAAEAVRIDASAPRSLILLGTARLRIAEYPTALRALSAAVEACGSTAGGEAKHLKATAHVLTAQAHERLRQYPEALAQVQLALSIDPTLQSARVTRALALQQQGRVEDAKNDLEAVLQRNPQNAQARLLQGYILLSTGDARAATALEMVVVGSSATRSLLGAAKCYLAMSLDTQGNAARSDQVVKEALALHRNLQTVWQEIQSQFANEPLPAVQKLRGLCDLDMTSLQARQLLNILARATGRGDLTISSVQMRPPANGRAGSIPPNRWAPVGSGTEAVGVGSGQNTPARMRSCSREPVYRQGSQVVQMPAGHPSMQPGQARGRSMSPGPQTLHYAGTSSGGYGSGYASGYASGYGSLQGSVRGSLQGSRAGSCHASRDSSPARGGCEPLQIHSNEMVRPEQLTFGPTLGSGGSAQVYRGTWNSKEVAIKKISGMSHLQEMIKEINALRRLKHPRLVHFWGACIQPPLLIVVTEFMSGGSLHDRLFGSRRSPALNPLQRWAIAAQTAEGLAFLHSNRVVHRDLKSMNILLDAAQNAKICDFGLAHQMEATHIQRNADGEGGSPRYMAPECYDPSLGKLTEKVDIWAAGCILIEIFANVLPYADCTTMVQLSTRITVEKRPPEVPQGVSPQITALARRCLVLEAARRVSAPELHGELSNCRPR